MTPSTTCPPDPGTKCPPDSGSATSADLTALWKQFTDADGTSVEGVKAKEAVKADFDAMAKASEEVGQIIEAYRKNYLQLSDQWKVLETAAEDPRYRTNVPETRRTEIKQAVTAFLCRVWEVEEAIDKRGCHNDLEEYAQEQIVLFDGKKHHADLIQRRFNYWKDEPKQIEARLKAWGELRDKADKAFGEQRFERAYFYIALLKQRIARQKQQDEETGRKYPGDSMSPLPPPKLRAYLIDLWRVLLGLRAQVRKARKEYDAKLSQLDQARKRLEQLNKTGVEVAIRDLDLDPQGVTK